MGDEVAGIGYTREQRQRYREKVRQCLDVFERMLSDSSFEFDRPLTGLEIELNLVDSQFSPTMANAAVLESIANPDYQTELGQFNIELNVSPRALPGDSALELEEALRLSLNHAEERANAADPLLSSLEPERRATLIAAPEDGGYRFDIPLQGDRETVFFGF